VYRSPNLDASGVSRLEDAEFDTSAISMATIGLIYAGIHLALWNYNFPTHAEMMLWKVSGIALAAPAASIFLLFLPV
jgi:hypothetical protein